MHPLFPLLLAVVALTFSCGSDFSPEGTYVGNLAMEDGSKLVTLELLADNNARMKGLFQDVVEGTWEKNSVGVGYGKDGVLASFEFKTIRIIFKLKQVEDGFILTSLVGRTVGKDILRPLKLKKGKPLFRQVD